MLLEAVSSELDPEKVILFGSHAFGKAKEDSDLDIAIIQKSPYKLGQKAKVYETLSVFGYDWKKEPDLHIFSEKDFNLKLENRDLFVSQISKGKVVYAKS